jgi:selT/selW/selH-like putative selenoprotein
MQTSLIHSRDIGAFEVRADGTVIFSKKESGRFPEHSEIIALLKKKNSSGNKTSFGKKGL